MKKIILALVAALGFAALSNAQPIKVSFVDASYDPGEYAYFSRIDLHDDGTCTMRQDHFVFNGLYRTDAGQDYPNIEPGSCYKFVMVWIDDYDDPRTYVGEITSNKNGTLFLQIAGDTYKQEEEGE